MKAIKVADTLSESARKQEKMLSEEVSSKKQFYENFVRCRAWKHTRMLWENDEKLFEI